MESVKMCEGEAERAEARTPTEVRWRRVGMRKWFTPSHRKPPANVGPDQKKLRKRQLSPADGKPNGFGTLLLEYIKV
jgi:hypothetical protein